MSKNKKETWIIGECNSEGEGVNIKQITGTLEQVKSVLMQDLKEDRDCLDTFDYGTTEEEIEEHTKDGEVYELYAYSVFADCHIDYTAIKASACKPIEL